MNRTPNSKEILTYFSQFLNEIGMLLASLKKQMYHLIQIPMREPKINSVFDSMSSIVFSTHRTYADLKKIQSVMGGYLKSRSLSKKQNSWSLSSTRVTKIRSKSEERQQEEFQNNQLVFNKKNIERDFFLKNNIKMRQNLQRKDYIVHDKKKSNENKDQYPLDFTKNDTKFKKINMLIDQKEAKPEASSFNQLHSIESKIKQLMLKNRKMYAVYNQRNQECLQMIKQAKQQLLINV